MSRPGLIALLDAVGADRGREALADAIGDALQAAYLRGRQDGLRAAARLGTPRIPQPREHQPVQLYQHGVTCAD